jgi:alcohol dehydrogenase (NADP+)
MPEHPMALPAPAPVLGRHRPAGSLIGGIAEMQEMLDFCAEQEVHPEIEVMAPGYINTTYERIPASDVRYRFVIDTQSRRA